MLQLIADRFFSLKMMSRGHAPVSEGFTFCQILYQHQHVLILINHLKLISFLWSHRAEN